MNPIRPTVLLIVAALLVACAKEVAPRTVTEFVDDEPLLEAALLRCTENRSESRYDPECINAREAVKRLEARQEAERRAELEELSDRKREALRRTQQAAAEARRRAAEAERRREEMEYQSQFGLTLPDTGTATEAMQGNVPGAMISAAGAVVPATAPRRDNPPGPAVPSPGQATVVAEAPPPAEPEAADLGAIRKELRRRNEEEPGDSP